MGISVERRVVVTGVGAVAPLGTDVGSSWKELLEGRSAAAPITAFDTSGHTVRFACEVKGFEPSEWIERRKARRMDRFGQLVVAAAVQAVEDSGLEIAEEPERVGVSVGTGMGGLDSFQGLCDVVAERGWERANPFSIPCLLPNMGAAWVSMQLGSRGPLGSQCTACAAGNMAIGEALDAIRLGRADVVLAGAGEAPITPLGVAGFAAMRALSRRNDAPELASRPFDADRDGFVIGEAGAVLVLEELQHAKSRNASVYAEVAGYGVSSDAQHITEPDPTGKNPARAMQMALQDASVKPDEIDYINAHGTSTPLGDASETRVIKTALGTDLARTIPISSTKGATGHCLGASGAVEAIFCALAIRTGTLPPTINQHQPDPDCDLDYIPNKPRQADVRVAVSNSFGFGGHNSTLILRRLED
jgi:3-oxoacyl-[acyl-carrier-protein] synthase II